MTEQKSFLASFFNTASQAVKDTASGFLSIDSVLSGANTLIAVCYALRFAGLAGTAGLSSALLTPGLILVLSSACAWYKGSRERTGEHSPACKP